MRPWELYSWPRRWIFLGVLFLVTTSSFFDYFILSIVLDPIKKEFNVSDIKLGLLSGFSFTLVYAIAGIPIARWADRGNRRTVITFAMTGWSVMTAACGLAQSFWQLAAARFGLGVFQPGAMPPAQSLVADYFPPERLATASAILSAGTATGYLIGIVLGGSIAVQFGWRSAFIFAGTTGIVLAFIARIALAEPRCHLGFPGRRGHAVEHLGEALRELLRKGTFLWTLVGISIYSTFAFGMGAFLPSFMIRSLHTTLQQLSAQWGAAISLANILGAIIGGRLADTLGRQDVRWFSWLPGTACLLATPLYRIALHTHQLWSFIVSDFAAELMLAIGISVCYVALHAISGRHRRTTAITIVQLVFTLVGGGFGPLLAGALSDAFSSAEGVESLRHSLTLMIGFLTPAALGFFLASRRILNELED